MHVKDLARGKLSSITRTKLKVLNATTSTREIRRKLARAEELPTTWTLCGIIRSWMSCKMLRMMIGEFLSWIGLQKLKDLLKWTILGLFGPNDPQRREDFWNEPGSDGICCHVRNRIVVSSVSLLRNMEEAVSQVWDVAGLLLANCSSSYGVHQDACQLRGRKEGIVSALCTLGLDQYCPLDFRASNVDKFVWKYGDVGLIMNGLGLLLAWIVVFGGVHVQMWLCGSILHPGIIGQEWTNK